MASKSISQLKADLATTFPNDGLATAAEFRAFMTDILDSVQRVPFYYDSSSEVELSGDVTRTHNLGINIVKCFVIDENGVVYEPDITRTSDDVTVIHWVGASLSNYSIYYLAF